MVKPTTFDSSVHECMQKIRTLIFKVEDNKQQKTHGTSTVLTLQILKWPWVQMAALSSWAIEAHQPTFLKKDHCHTPSVDFKYEFNLPEGVLSNKEVGGLGPHIKFGGKIWGKVQPSSQNKRKNL